jgi:Mn-dependent DtxR family transcriptional regulator
MVSAKRIPDYLQHIKDEPNITIKELMDKMGFKESTVRDYVNTLRCDNLIEEHEGHFTLTEAGGHALNSFKSKKS